MAEVVDLQLLAQITNVETELKKVQAQLSRANLKIPVKISTRDAKRLDAAARNVRRAGLVDSDGLVDTKLAKSINDLNKLGKQLNRSKNLQEDLGKQTAITLRRFAGYRIATGVIFGVGNAFAESTKQAISFNREFVKTAQLLSRGQRRVNVGQLSTLRDTINRTSTQFSVDAGALTKATNVLANAGRTAAEIRQLISAIGPATLTATFGDLTEQKISSLNALLGQFKISAGQSGAVLDSLNAVTKNFNVSIEELLAGTQRAGATFAAFSNIDGPSRDNIERLREFTGLFTAIISTSRESAATIGTSLRTILPRLSRGSTQEELESLGVSVNDEAGRLRKPFELLGSIRDELVNEEGVIDVSEKRVRSIVEALGGLRQFNRVIPLLQNYDNAVKAINIAQNSQGSVAEDAAQAQENLAVQISKVREEFNKFIREVVESGSFERLSKTLIDVASALVKVADTVRPLIPLLTVAGTIAAIRGAPGLARGFTRNLTNFNDGGPVGFNLGGAVKLTPGEIVIPPKGAASIGYDKLNRVNRTGDGLSGLSLPAGSKIVPGTGNTDTFNTNLPDGSFVLRKGVSEKIISQRFNSGGVVGRKKLKLQVGGPVFSTSTDGDDIIAISRINAGIKALGNLGKNISILTAEVQKLINLGIKPATIAGQRFARLARSTPSINPLGPSGPPLSGTLIAGGGLATIPGRQSGARVAGNVVNGRVLDSRVVSRSRALVPFGTRGPGVTNGAGTSLVPTSSFNRPLVPFNRPGGALVPFTPAGPNPFDSQRARNVSQSNIDQALREARISNRLAQGLLRGGSSVGGFLTRRRQFTPNLRGALSSQGLGIAAGVAGGALLTQRNAGSQFAGGALTGASIGAFAGSAFGPVGTAIGGLTGAVVGATSALSSFKKTIEDDITRRSVESFDRRISRGDSVLDSVRDDLVPALGRETQRFFSDFNSPLNDARSFSGTARVANTDRLVEISRAVVDNLNSEIQKRVRAATTESGAELSDDAVLSIVRDVAGTSNLGAGQFSRLSQIANSRNLTAGNAQRILTGQQTTENINIQNLVDGFKVIATSSKEIAIAYQEQADLLSAANRNLMLFSEASRSSGSFLSAVGSGGINPNQLLNVFNNLTGVDSFQAIASFNALGTQGAVSDRFRNNVAASAQLQSGNFTDRLLSNQGGTLQEAITKLLPKTNEVDQAILKVFEGLDEQLTVRTAQNSQQLSPILDALAKELDGSVKVVAQAVDMYNSENARLSSALSGISNALQRNETSIINRQTAFRNTIADIRIGDSGFAGTSRNVRQAALRDQAAVSALSGNNDGAQGILASIIRLQGQRGQGTISEQNRVNTEIIRLTEALNAGAAATERLTAIQEKIREIQQAQQGSQSFLDRVAFGDAGAIGEINRAITDFQILAQGGNLSQDRASAAIALRREVTNALTNDQLLAQTGRTRQELENEISRIQGRALGIRAPGDNLAQTISENSIRGRDNANLRAARAEQIDAITIQEGFASALQAAQQANLESQKALVEKQIQELPNRIQEVFNNNSTITAMNNLNNTIKEGMNLQNEVQVQVLGADFIPHLKNIIKDAIQGFIEGNGDTESPVQ